MWVGQSAAQGPIPLSQLCRPVHMVRHSPFSVQPGEQPVAVPWSPFFGTSSGPLHFDVADTEADFGAKRLFQRLTTLPPEKVRLPAHTGAHTRSFSGTQPGAIELSIARVGLDLGLEHPKSCKSCEGGVARWFGLLVTHYEI